MSYLRIPLREASAFERLTVIVTLSERLLFMVAFWSAYGYVRKHLTRSILAAFVFRGLIIAAQMPHVSHVGAKRIRHGPQGPCRMARTATGCGHEAGAVWKHCNILSSSA